MNNFLIAGIIYTDDLTSLTKPDMIKARIICYLNENASTNNQVVKEGYSGKLAKVISKCNNIKHARHYD